MKIAFMFAGQGSQHKGMGLDLYNYDLKSKELFDSYPKLRDLCFFDSKSKLDETKYAQPAILLESYVIASYLKNKGIIPEYVNGLSLGEYSALTFANAYSIDDAIKIITQRGQIMQNALPLGTSSMAAIIGMNHEKISEVIKEIPGVCEIAKYISPIQIVITGSNDSIDLAIDKLKENGAKKCIKLNVSGAFHSSLLNDASIKLNEVLNKYVVKKPDIKVIYNIYGKETNEDIIGILTKQIKSSVMFMQSIEYMIDCGINTFIEIGPGTALSGFVKKINPNVKAYSTDTLDDIFKILEELL